VSKLQSNYRVTAQGLSRVAGAQLFHVNGAPISWCSVFDFTKNIKHASDLG